MTSIHFRKRRLARLQRLGSDFLFLSGGAVLIVLVSVAVVWPLWYLATHHLAVYTFLCLGLLLFGLGWVSVVRFRRRKLARDI
ncbi:MAG: hypothetical protein KKI09_05390 [Spirochaetes bacterium]|nr:hypothetical protein [Spirochaetota bacterium]MBU0954847.1 hypothetical protein [Spirochaetota bacterium]